jgi:hypothetical protein
VAADAPVLWTIADICRELDVSRDSVYHWRRKQHHRLLGPFPQPVVNHGAGLWDPAEVKAWDHKRKSFPGSLKGVTVGLYRRYGNMAHCARVVGKDVRTVRGWLVEQGEIDP